MGKIVHRYHVVIKKRGKGIHYLLGLADRVEVGTFNFTGAHILNCCLGVVMYTYYAFTKNWIMSNIFGLAVAFNSLEVTPPGDKVDGSTSNSTHSGLVSFY